MLEWAMVHVQSDPNQVLVRLITRLVCSPRLRTKVLDSIAAYLARSARASGDTVDDIMSDQETYVLGSLYRLLASVYESYLLEGLTTRQADARVGHWLSERLAEFKQP